jgi:hypothetical protein
MRTEAPESAHFDPLALAQRTNHAVEDDLEYFLRFLERNSSGLGNLQLKLRFGEIRHEAV